jgi:hypothetical protein
MDEDHSTERDDSGSEDTLSSSGSDDEELPFENSEAEDQGTSSFGSVKIATATCLHTYAIDRMKGAENYSIPWPPLMLIVLHHLNRRYKRRELVTERNIAMLELLLRVPIQLKIEHGGSSRGGRKEYIDLNRDESLDFTGVSFVESLELLQDLLRDKVIKQEHIRASVTMGE